MRPVRELTVAVVQSVPVRGGVEENLRRAATAVRSAQEAGAGLVVFPELSLTGYDLGLLADPGMWFSPGDDRLAQIRSVAEASGTAVVVGAPVEADGHRYIASLLLTGTGPDRVAPKTYLHGAEADVVEPGSGALIADVGGWNVALAVCHDTAFPDHARSARQAGAAAYVASVLYTVGEERRMDVRMAARAMDNGMFSVAANLGGHPLGARSAGGSGGWAPDGAVIATASGRDEESVLTILTPDLMAEA